MSGLIAKAVSDGTTKVDTITKNNKNYFNQQLKQLVSYLSLRLERFFQQHCAAINSLPRSKKNTNIKKFFHTLYILGIFESS